MERRKFNQLLLTSISSYALIESIFTSHAIGGKIEPILKHWSVQLNEYCNDLNKSNISLTEWQNSVEGLFAIIELPELLKFINFEELVKNFQYPDLGVNTKYVKFPILEGLPTRTAFIKKIFGMKKDRSIIPHGHSNMVSAHLILKGDMHLRHYEKISEEDNHLYIKPTIDKTISKGDYSSISDDKDNVHWFVAESETAFTFDVIMLDLDEKPYDIHNIDIYEKVQQNDGSLRVPILDVETALHKYGKVSHH